MKPVSILMVLAMTILLGFLAIAQTQPTEDVQANFDDVEEYLRNFRKDLDLASITVGLVKNGEVVWTGAFGKTNIEQDIDVQTNNIFVLGSTSKLFTATAVMQLWEKGKINLGVSPIRSII